MKCKECGQPMKPEGVRKKPNEYDHAAGCPLAPQKLTRAKKRCDYPINEGMVLQVSCVKGGMRYSCKVYDRDPRALCGCCSKGTMEIKLRAKCSNSLCEALIDRIVRGHTTVQQI